MATAEDRYKYESNEVYQADKSARDFVAFAEKLGITREQLKSGDFGQAKSATLDKAGNVVVKDKKDLGEQGILLYSLFTKYKDPSDPETKKLDTELPIEHLKKLVSDAAFKTVDPDEQTIMHVLLTPTAYTKPDKIFNSEKWLPIIANATPAQLQLQDKEEGKEKGFAALKIKGDTPLNIMLRYNPQKKPEGKATTTEERNYQEIKEVLRIIDKQTLEGLAEDPRTGKPYPIVYEVINERDAQAAKKTDGKVEQPKTLKPNGSPAGSGHASKETPPQGYLEANRLRITGPAGSVARVH